MKTILALVILLGASTSYACKVNDPDIGSKYIGECKDGYAHGVGHAQGRDVYVGSFSKGEPHGYGVYIWGEKSQWPGDIYEGEWRNGEREGNGKYKSNFGYLHEGGYLESKAYGYGVLKLNLETGKKRFGDEIKNMPKSKDLYVVEGLFIDNNFVGLCKPQECLEALKKILSK